MPDGFTDAHERRSEKSSSSHEGVSPCLDSMPKNLSAIDCGLLASKPSPRATSSSAMNSGDAMANVQQMRWGTARGRQTARAILHASGKRLRRRAMKFACETWALLCTFLSNTVCTLHECKFNVLNTTWAVLLPRSSSLPSIN